MGKRAGICNLPAGHGVRGEEGSGTGKGVVSLLGAKQLMASGAPVQLLPSFAGFQGCAGSCCVCLSCLRCTV